MEENGKKGLSQLTHLLFVHVPNRVSESYLLLLAELGFEGMTDHHMPSFAADLRHQHRSGYRRRRARYSSTIRAARKQLEEPIPHPSFGRANRRPPLESSSFSWPGPSVKESVRRKKMLSDVN